MHIPVLEVCVISYNIGDLVNCFLTRSVFDASKQREMFFFPRGKTLYFHKGFAW